MRERRLTRAQPLLSLLACLAVATACSPRPAEKAGAPDPPEPAVLDSPARGEYLVTLMGCHDCHTPLQMGPQGPRPDMSRMLSGHPEDFVLPDPPVRNEVWSGALASTMTAFAGPWGISYATNLTPDASGMAAWDEETFVSAMRTGKHFGTSRDILPPMPWPSIGRATDEDLAAIFAYLQTIPPVVNHVPEAVIPEARAH